MSAKKKPTAKTAEQPAERSPLAGGCVLALLGGAMAAGLWAASPTAAVLSGWAIGMAALWRCARRMSDSSATPPPGGTTPLGDEEAGQTLTDGTTLARREGMLIFSTPDAANPLHTHVRVVQTADDAHA